MSICDSFAAEMRHEANATREMLAAAPEERFAWAPHEKSMKLGRLCGHIAEIPGWAEHIVTQDELDFAQPMGEMLDPASRGELLTAFDERLEQFFGECADKPDEHWFETWTLRNGEKVLMQQPRIAVARGWLLNHTYHHRGQLSVYLRLLDVPLPPVYGPTADAEVFS